jgi:hypothetical protein
MDSYADYGRQFVGAKGKFGHRDNGACISLDPKPRRSDEHEGQS